MDKKYNTGQPIDIETLSKDELKEAFHEWAEGCDLLEELLIEGYNKGLFSKACCSGDNVLPYIAYKLENNNARKLAIYIARQLVESDLDCKVTVYDDFWLNKEDPERFPEKEIYELVILTHSYNRDEIFELIIKSIKEANIENIELPTEESEIPRKDFKKREERKLEENSDTSKQNEQQLISGVIEQSKEIGIRVDEINSANREIRKEITKIKEDYNQTYDKEVE